jgi:anti-sigma28 factor (negative regulator of flagellin synthesis)
MSLFDAKMRVPVDRWHRFCLIPQYAVYDEISPGRNTRMFAHHQDEALDLRRMETMSSSGRDSAHDTKRGHLSLHEDRETGCCDTEENSGASGKDHEMLPSRDRDMQRAKQVVEEAPEIREELVAAAKRALRTGTLNLEGTALAEKMLSESLHKSSKQV